MRVWSVTRSLLLDRRSARPAGSRSRPSGSGSIRRPLAAFALLAAAGRSRPDVATTRARRVRGVRLRRHVPGVPGGRDVRDGVGGDGHQQSRADPGRRERADAVPVREGHRHHVDLQRRLRRGLAPVHHDRGADGRQRGHRLAARDHEASRRHHRGHLPRPPAVLLRARQQARRHHRPERGRFRALWYVLSPAAPRSPAAPDQASPLTRKVATDVSNTSSKVLYTAEAVTEGGRTGHGRTSDGRLDVQLSAPESMGGQGGPGTNPEQLFAVGYAACFQSAVLGVAQGRHLDVSDCQITAGSASARPDTAASACKSPWTCTPRTCRRPSPRTYGPRRPALPVLQRHPRRHRGHPASRGAHRAHRSLNRIFLFFFFFFH